MAGHEPKITSARADRTSRSSCASPVLFCRTVSTIAIVRLPSAEVKSDSEATFDQSEAWTWRTLVGGRGLERCWMAASNEFEPGPMCGRTGHPHATDGSGGSRRGWITLLSSSTAKETANPADDCGRRRTMRDS